MKLLNAGLLFWIIAWCSTGEAQAENTLKSGRFSITELNQSCAVFTEYHSAGKSDIKLMLHVRGDDLPILAVNSEDWSTVDGLEYPGITYSVNGQIYTDMTDEHGHKLLSTEGYTVDGTYGGYIRVFPDSFVDDFAQGESLSIKNGEVVIAHLSLHDSRNAVAKLRDCLANVEQ